MNPPSTKTIPHLWKRLVQVLAYHISWFVIMLALVVTRHLPSFLPFVLVPLLWLCARRSSPLRPKLPEQHFSLVESWLWFGGACVCALIVLGCAYGIGIRGTLELFQAVAAGAGSWAFVFLTYRDCRRTIHCAQIA